MTGWPPVLLGMGVVAFLVWSAALWRDRGVDRPEVRDALGVTVLLVITTGTLSAFLDRAADPDFANMVRAAGRAAATVGGLYALAATFRGK